MITWTVDEAKKDPRGALEWAATQRLDAWTLSIKLAATEAQRDAAVEACEMTELWREGNGILDASVLRAAIALTRGPEGKG